MLYLNKRKCRLEQIFLNNDENKREIVKTLENKEVILLDLHNKWLSGEISDCIFDTYTIKKKDEKYRLHYHDLLALIPMDENKIFLDEEYARLLNKL